MTTMWQFEQLDEVPSTMDVARARAMEGCSEGTTIVARAQSAGRGRHGRSWVAQRDAGLWMSVIVRPTSPEAHQLSLVAGVAVAHALHDARVANVGLKWPNDVLIGDRKIAGILLEADQVGSSRAFVIIGVGINVAQGGSLKLPVDVEERYIGLLDTVEVPDQHRALAELRDGVLQHLQQAYHEWRSSGLDAIKDTWNHLDALRGKQVRAEVDGKMLVGLAEGIGDQGELRVRSNGVLARVFAGEVHKVDV